MPELLRCRTFVVATAGFAVEILCFYFGKRKVSAWRILHGLRRFAFPSRIGSMLRAWLLSHPACAPESSLLRVLPCGATVASASVFVTLRGFLVRRFLG